MRPLGAVSIGPDDLIILEGVPALAHSHLAKLAGVRVHVEMPETERIARLRADYRWRGESDAAVDALIASRAADECEPVQKAGARGLHRDGLDHRMIVSKTPFRMSFVGGGSDVPAFYREETGAVLSTSIDKYVSPSIGI